MKNFQIHNTLSGTVLGVYQGETAYDAVVALNKEGGGDEECLACLIDSDEICVEEMGNND